LTQDLRSPFVTKQTKSRRKFQRMLVAARMALDGRNPSEIARALDVSWTAVHKWRKSPQWKRAMANAGAPLPLPEPATIILPGPVMGEPGSMTLKDYAARYIAERPGVCEQYRRLMVATVDKLHAWVGRDLQLGEVSKSLLVAWVAYLHEERRDRPATINGKTAMIRRLLLAAYEDELLEKPPRKIRRIRERTAPPRAWRIEEVRRLVTVLSHLPGTVGEVRECDFWESLVLALYWSGCRVGAMLTATAENYAPGEGLVVLNQKNGRGQWYAFPPSCCVAIERVLPETGLIWPWPQHRRTLFNHFRHYVEAAGIPAPRTGRALFYSLRRTNASYCAAEDPSLAQKQLGHSSLAVTRRHYIDPSIARGRSAADVLPDPLGPPGLRVVSAT
jgi:integrase